MADKEHPYFKKMGWPRLGGRGVPNQGGGDSYGRAGGRYRGQVDAPQQTAQAQQRNEPKPSVISKPVDYSLATWHVGTYHHDPSRTRTDPWHVHSTHKTEQEAKDAGVAKATELHTEHFHYRQPMDLAEHEPVEPGSSN